MKITKPYEYTILDRVTSDNGSRYYIDNNGVHLSSVTTILSATSFSPELEAWKERVGLQEAERIRTEATNLGSLMHTHLENHIQNIERPRGNNLIRQMARNMADVIISRGLINIDEVWGMEEMLYYPNLYAGTADLIAIHNGSPAICDYKTTNKMKSKDKITDYFCQGVAYAHAHNTLFQTNINKIVIFMVSRNLEYKEFVIEGNEFDHYSNIWCSRLEQYFKTYHQHITNS